MTRTCFASLMGLALFALGACDFAADVDVVDAPLEDAAVPPDGGFSYACRTSVSAPLPPLPTVTTGPTGRTILERWRGCCARESCVRTWPYPTVSWLGELCLSHTDCDEGLLCKQGPGPYGLCLCPETDPMSVDLGDDC